MSSIIQAAARQRSFWLASSFLVPVLPFAISAVYTQQSASPDLLPPIEVNPPKRVETTQPAPKQNSN
jgi:hypothetical protein